MRTYIMIRDMVIGFLGGVSIAVLGKVGYCGVEWMVL